MARKPKRKDTAAKPDVDPAPIFGGPRVTPKLERVLSRAIAKFSNRPEVTGVDLGLKFVEGKRTEALCIRVHVREKYATRYLEERERIPKTFLSVPTDVIEAVYSDEQGPPRDTRAAVIQPGLGISHTNGGTGTLGLLVLDAQGRQALLSAKHVLFPDTNSQPGDALLQPARMDNGQNIDTIAAVDRGDPDTDSAYARLFNVRPVDPRILGTDVGVTFPQFPAIGSVLQKSGRGTGVTSAVVDGISPVMSGIHYAMHLSPLQPGDPPISLGGDSGAVWYDPATGAGIGLHCKGGTAVSATNFAIASSLSYVFRRLRLSLS